VATIPRKEIRIAIEVVAGTDEIIATTIEIEIGTGIDPRRDEAARKRRAAAITDLDHVPRNEKRKKEEEVRVEERAARIRAIDEIRTIPLDDIAKGSGGIGTKASVERGTGAAGTAITIIPLKLIEMIGWR